MAFFCDLLIGAALSGGIALAAWRRGSLSSTGVTAALFVGAAIYLGGGLAWYAALMAFFVTSTLLGRLGAAHKERVRRHYEKGETRDGWQVLANGGIAAACALAQRLLPEVDLTAAFVGALATANGDTWATELGVLGNRPPLLVTTLRRVPAGTSGAISGFGVTATILGGAVIGAVIGLAGWRDLGAWLVVGGVSGCLGALADSVLGATVQAGYRCLACDRACEAPRHHCGRRARHVKGLRWCTNDVVNVLATLVGAAIGLGLGSW
ncbi:MAG: DUF92 domain-containing protein [Nannocystaceae bacterium]